MKNHSGAPHSTEADDGGTPRATRTQRSRGTDRDAQRETVITFSDADAFAIVDTMHGRFRRACEEVIRRTGRGRERNPERGIREDRKVRWEFEIPAEAIRVPMAPRQLSDEQRANAAIRARAMRGRQLLKTGSVDPLPDGNAVGAGNP